MRKKENMDEAGGRWAKGKLPSTNIVLTKVNDRILYRSMIAVAFVLADFYVNLPLHKNILSTRKSIKRTYILFLFFFAPVQFLSFLLLT